MKLTPIIDIAEKKLYVHHQKRERAVYFDSENYYKLWVKGWEHSAVAKHGFEIEYYDDFNASVFRSFIVDPDGSHLGYSMKKGTSIGGSRDNWQKLIGCTTDIQRKKFIKEIFQRSIIHRCIVSDMCPANVVVDNGKISLIDYEGLGSFSWFFEGKPQVWEAQNRNLDKYPKPLWRDMSKYLRQYVAECLQIDFEEDIKTEESFLRLHQLVMEKTEDA